MNKNQHRIVFNQARGQMMAVAENAPARGKSRGKAALPLKGVASAVCLAAGMMGMASSAYAQISADNRQGKAPGVSAAGNGTPLVNINAASGAGVSVNHYAQFNTDSRGAILNNSAAASQTQLAGAIAGNANMANGAARIIINQVTGNMPSNLVGNIEVAGRRAEVVLSNPNGITVNGAGFINTSRAVLTTGSPALFDQNGLSTVRVTKGEIVVNKLDGRGTDQVDLIARAVKINGEIHADNALNVVAGINEVYYRNATSPASLGAVRGPKPAVAIDVAALGGMYANKIALIGTERGVGVNIGGIVEAKESLHLDSGGNLALRDTARLQGGQVNIDSLGSINNSGSVESKGTLLVHGADSLVNGKTGVMNAGGRLALGARTVSNDGAISSKDNLSAFVESKFTNSSSGVMHGGKNVEINSDSVAQAGKITAGADMLVRVSGGEELVNSGALKAGKALEIHSEGGFKNTVSGELSAGSLSVGTRGALRNEGLIEATAGDAFVASDGKLSNAATGVIRANKNVELVSFDAVEQNGLVAGKTVRVTASDAGVSNTGTIQAADRISFNTSGPLVNTGTLTAPSIVFE
ncbi:filamentous hemagglutinin N-terminal domain-containing protein [Herbaspirillum robiniae]|uniref:two-partner secretion domain-containing protein n=1 Tax=Herbaspirillum robiniae TaxID=2014887 RepID=UPI003D781B51